MISFLDSLPRSLLVSPELNAQGDYAGDDEDIHVEDAEGQMAWMVFDDVAEEGVGDHDQAESPEDGSDDEAAEVFVGFSGEIAGDDDHGADDRKGGKNGDGPLRRWRKVPRVLKEPREQA